MTRQGGPAVGTVHCIEFAVLLPLRGRERHAAPLQWRVRSAILPGNLQLPMALATRKGHAASVRRQSRQRLRSERRYIFLSPGGLAQRPPLRTQLVHTILSAVCTNRRSRQLLFLLFILKSPRCRIVSGSAVHLVKKVPLGFFAKLLSELQNRILLYLILQFCRCGG